MPNISEGSVRIATLQDAAQAVDNGKAMDVGGMSSLALQIMGAFVGTITFEASLTGEDNTWVALLGQSLVGGQSATATAEGIYQFNITGLRYFRARVSAYTSGEITVIGRAMPFPLAPLASVEPVMAIDQSTPGTTNKVVAQLSGSNVVDITFHNEATVAANGTVFTVDGYKTLTVEILGTVTSFTIVFTGEGASGAVIPLMGINLSDLSTAISTNTSGQLWQFDISGLTKVFMDLTAITAGTGNVTVKGKAVA